MDATYSHFMCIKDSLVDCVRYQLPHLVPSRKVGLVVIDSVAATFRAEDGAEVNKAAPLQALGYRLHQLASSYGVAVVAINQVCSFDVHLHQTHFIFIYISITMVYDQIRKISTCLSHIVH